MIAKIMKSAGGFDAVYYNENKVKEQKAELLSVANFHTSGTNLTFLSTADYISYFNKISNLNGRVKNQQFHAVLSTRGQVHTAQELKSIAEEYIKQMGYGDNPYLIYFHQDTQNNHVHIVSTRVDKNSEKVDDAFEKYRSLATIRKIMQTPKHLNWTPQDLIDDVLGYNFSTEGQLKTLLELRGYSTKEGDNREIQVWKDNLFVTSIDRQTVNEKLKSPKDEQRLKQIRAIVLKYKEGRGDVALDSFLKEKFGLDVVFHKTGDSATPYGYTIVDNANKQVFKGSEILKMSEFLKNIPVSNLKNSVDVNHQKVVEDFISKNEMDALQDYLNNHDLILMQKGDELFLIDRQNDEVFNMSGSRSQINESLILDFSEESDKSKEYLLDLNIPMGSASESETDRKRKKGIKR
jgi:Relaxase/Mobilisation nuclease domain